MKWVGMVLKGREEMEAELEDIESRWGCRDVVIVCMILLTATRPKIAFLEPYLNKKLAFETLEYFAKFRRGCVSTLSTASCRRILAWQDNHFMA